EDNGQPSEYLRKRCPLCFGAKDWRRQRAGDVKIDCIVCIDANFTQKRSKNPWGAQGQDPSNPTRSFFISIHEVTSMEAHSDQCRSRGRERQRRPVNAMDDEDVVEEGMRIPVSVLKGCGESFTAADERREKASTQFFADTRLMAMLC
ncbi:hypothetical protein HYDPIDRAFT_67719, partial [Hydnomerulius pinastri MD-312]